MLDNHDVHSQFHPMARRDFYSDRNVQESSAEDVQPDKEASMNSLQEAQDMHVNYGECHYVETKWGYEIYTINSWLMTILFEKMYK